MFFIKLLPFSLHHPSQQSPYFITLLKERASQDDQCTPGVWRGLGAACETVFHLPGMSLVFTGPGSETVRTLSQPPHLWVWGTHRFWTADPLGWNAVSLA